LWLPAHSNKVSWFVLFCVFCLVVVVVGFLCAKVLVGLCFVLVFWFGCGFRLCLVVVVEVFGLEVGEKRNSFLLN
jgi:hypothetical protein